VKEKVLRERESFPPFLREKGKKGASVARGGEKANTQGACTTREKKGGRGIF